MYIKIRNKLIVTPVSTILRQAKRELTNGKLKDITDEDKININITCPSHKGGFEGKPSCQIFNDPNHPKREVGFAHCFSCGYAGPLSKVIGDLFDQNQEFGEDWLLERFGDVFVQQKEYLPPIEINQTPTLKTPVIIPEDELLQYDFYHPYMWTRKLTKDVVDQFRVGYDKVRQAITFPVYDEKHRLVMVTARSVNSKFFYIPEDVEKPVYLLYDILQRGITKVYVCESQINTLYLRSLGYNSIGLFGTGSKEQLQTLKRSGIRNYILCFDGDEAGRKGANRFKRTMGDSVFITDILLPWGKDVNDLSPEQVNNLLNNS